MKHGFTLIEVLVAATLASLLSIALFLSWGQIQRAAVSADNTMSIGDRLMVLQRQFEQDFMGTCVPISRPYTKPTSEEETAKPAEKPSANLNEKTEQKEKPKPVERVFYASTQANDLLDTVTFLTNNPMQVYWSERAGGARPRIARVQYTLKKDAIKGEKNVSYTLSRQEANTLDPDRFSKDADNKIRSYDLITGIKELKLTYWQEVQVEKEGEKPKEAEKPKEGEKPKEEKPASKIVKDIKKVAVWDLSKEKPPKNTFIRPIPIMIKVEVSLWDLQKKKARSFTFMIPIPIDIENPAEKKKEEPKIQSVIPLLPLPGNKKQGAADTKTQVHTEVVVVNLDKGSMLKELLNGKVAGEKKK